MADMLFVTMNPADTIAYQLVTVAKMLATVTPNMHQSTNIPLNALLTTILVTFIKNLISL